MRETENIISESRFVTLNNLYYFVIFAVQVISVFLQREIAEMFFIKKSDNIINLRFEAIKRKKHRFCSSLTENDNETPIINIYDIFNINKFFNIDKVKNHS